MKWIMFFISVSCIFYSGFSFGEIFSGKSGDIKCDKLISVYDGDTFKCKVNAMPEGFKTMSFRVSGVDTPEIRNSNPALKEQAYRARDFTRSFLESGGNCA